MAPVHPRQGSRIERLGADRDAIDPREPPRGDRRVVYVLGICFERDFGVRLEGQSCTQDVEQMAHTGGAERDGVPPPRYTFRTGHWVLAVGESQRQFARDSRDVGVDRHVTADRDGEVAIGAPPRAERHVDVHVPRSLRSWCALVPGASPAPDLAGHVALDRTGKLE